MAAQFDPSKKPWMDVILRKSGTSTFKITPLAVNAKHFENLECIATVKVNDSKLLDSIVVELITGTCRTPAL